MAGQIMTSVTNGLKRLLSHLLRSEIPLGNQSYWYLMGINLARQERCTNSPLLIMSSCSLFPHSVPKKLQPFYFGGFGPFQIAWVKECEASVIEGDPITRENIVERYMKVSNYLVCYII